MNSKTSSSRFVGQLIIFSRLFFSSIRLIKMKFVRAGTIKKNIKKNVRLGGISKVKFSKILIKNV